MPRPTFSPYTPANWPAFWLHVYQTRFKSSRPAYNLAERFTNQSKVWNPAVTYILVRCWIILGQAWVSSNCIWNAPTQTHLSYLSSQTTMATWTWAISFTVKPWASRGIHAMYEWSCQANTWSQRTPCCPTITHSLPCHTIVRLVPQFRK